MTTTNSKRYEVWGRGYDTIGEMVARQTEIHEVNRRYGESDDRVCEINALKAKIDWLSAVAEQRRRETERPYYLLYRKYDENGHCYKGRRRFRTRKEQSDWIWAHDECAITASN